MMIDPNKEKFHTQFARRVFMKKNVYDKQYSVYIGELSGNNISLLGLFLE